MNIEPDISEHGYICKRCNEAAPLGVGYASYDHRITYADSKDLTSCQCGYSQKAQPAS